MRTEEPIGELEERLSALSRFLRIHFSADELHDLAELVADDLLLAGVDVRSAESLDSTVHVRMHQES